MSGFQQLSKETIFKYAGERHLRSHHLVLIFVTDSTL